MSEQVERALARLELGGSVIAPERSGRGFGVFAKGDRRRRPVVRLTAMQVRNLESAGAIVPDGNADCFVLSPAGAARVARTTATPAEAYLAQHRPIVPRTVMDAGGEPRSARGHERDDAVRKLSEIRDASGAPWFTADELAIAARLRADWECGQVGLVKVSILQHRPGAKLHAAPEMLPSTSLAPAVMRAVALRKRWRVWRCPCARSLRRSAWPSRDWRRSSACIRGRHDLVSWR